MIKQALASKLLIPLWQLFPRSDETPDYQDIITRTLAKVSSDEAHARATVERLIDVSHYKPLPAEVNAAAGEVARPVEPVGLDEWVSARKPGDEPFNGLADLVDDRLVEVLRRKAEHGLTHAERESAKRFLQLRVTQPAEAGGGG